MRGGVGGRGGEEGAQHGEARGEELALVEELLCRAEGGRGLVGGERDGEFKVGGVRVGGGGREGVGFGVVLWSPPHCSD